MDAFDKIAQMRIDMIDQLHRRNMRRLMWCYVLAICLITAFAAYAVKSLK